MSSSATPREQSRVICRTEQEVWNKTGNDSSFRAGEKKAELLYLSCFRGQSEI